jgi:hypothetical protein
METAYLVILVVTFIGCAVAALGTLARLVAGD